MKVVAGLDGCPSGWLCLWGDPRSDRLEGRVLRRLDELLDLVPLPEVVGVDIPIGLPGSGVRACDRGARKLLGRPRSSSVFPAPIRPMLEARSHGEACDIGQCIHGRKLSRQAWNILPKVREMDDFLAGAPGRQGWIREVHPEVSFMAWNGGAPMRYNKRTGEGERERLALVEGGFGPAWRAALESLPASGYGRDDVLDALAAFWSARRIATGGALRLPPEPERDARGLAMEILA